MPAKDKTEYLWSARAEYARHIDNLRQAAMIIEATEEELSALRVNYDFPDGTEPDELLGKLAEAKESLTGIVSSGTEKVASFHETLMSQEAR